MAIKQNLTGLKKGAAMKTKPFHVAQEVLSHFNCPECEKWWSISDAPTDRPLWFCPWCGWKITVKP